MSVFSARGLTKTYDMGEVQVHALRGVDLDLYEGELAVLLGPSGSGKSTLLNILGGLDTATSGVVRYHDKELTSAGDRELTQDPDVLDTWATSSLTPQISSHWYADPARHKQPKPPRAPHDRQPR